MNLDDHMPWVPLQNRNICLCIINCAPTPKDCIQSKAPDPQHAGTGNRIVYRLQLGATLLTVLRTTQKKNTGDYEWPLSSPTSGAEVSDTPRWRSAALDDPGAPPRADWCHPRDFRMTTPDDPRAGVFRSGLAADHPQGFCTWRRSPPACEHITAHLSVEPMSHQK